MNRIAISVITPILVLFSSMALHTQTPQSLQIVQATYGTGTRVRLVQDKGDTFRVTDGSTAFDVSTDNLTNNPAK